MPQILLTLCLLPGMIMSSLVTDKVCPFIFQVLQHFLLLMIPTSLCSLSISYMFLPLIKTLWVLVGLPKIITCISNFTPLFVLSSLRLITPSCFVGILVVMVCISFLCLRCVLIVSLLFMLHLFLLTQITLCFCYTQITLCFHCTHTQVHYVFPLA